MELGKQIKMHRQEAHLSQEELANLLDADKNAIKIALTGTPLLKEERESWRVFGNYIHTYYYDKSILDGYCLLEMQLIYIALSVMTHQPEQGHF